MKAIGLFFLIFSSYGFSQTNKPQFDDLLDEQTKKKNEEDKIVEEKNRERTQKMQQEARLFFELERKKYGKQEK